MLNHFKNTIMICTHCHHEMSRKHHSAGNTGSKWGERALAAACLIGGALGTAIIPGPGELLLFLAHRLQETLGTVQKTTMIIGIVVIVAKK